MTSAETDTARDRHVALDGVFNMRDLGGYPADGGAVRWGMLYRADGIHRLAGRDLDAVRSLGVRTVVDLRTPGELADHGRFPVHELDVAFHHLPVLERTWDADGHAPVGGAARFLADRYLEMLSIGGPSIAAALRLLADPASYPLVFHCAAGKDRTGVLAAVVLTVLGVPAPQIVHDYSLSRLGMDRLLAWIRSNKPEVLEVMAAQPEAFLAAPPEAMTLTLEVIRIRYGSISSYLDDLGVDGSTLDAVRAALVQG